MAMVNSPIDEPKFLHIMRCVGSASLRRRFWRIPLGRHRYLFEDFVEDRLSLALPTRAGVRHDKAVFKDRVRESLDIVRNDKTTSFRHRKRLGCAEQSKRASRANTEFDLGMF